MCYSEFGDIIKEIEKLDADVITFEATKSGLTLVSTLSQSNFKTQVGPGVYDIHSPRVPTSEEIFKALSGMLELLPKEKLWVNPDCGLKTRKEEEVIPSLKNMVRAAARMRSRLEK
jgi:5-methyltetrahydropteroyltriglutamate--homocysteine methyltransferase